jgi:hypothetical protein
VKGLSIGVVQTIKVADSEITNAIRKIIKPMKNQTFPNCNGRKME